MPTLPPADASPSIVVSDQGGASGGGTSPVWSFDVATIARELPADGRRDISRPRWTRVVIAADRLVDAHLDAALMGSCHGMVIDVRYRE